ncbi:MAG: hypothetical protein WDO24_11305 [Pseudomonadota bacterium]
MLRLAGVSTPARCPAISASSVEKKTSAGRIGALGQQLVVAHALIADVVGQTGAGLALEQGLEIGLDAVLGDAAPGRHGQGGGAFRRRGSGRLGACAARHQRAGCTRRRDTADEAPSAQPRDGAVILIILVPRSRWKNYKAYAGDGGCARMAHRLL